MARKASGPSGHTGQTSSGNVKDVKVDRIGPVTIYKRGLSYFLYFREAGKELPPEGRWQSGGGTGHRHAGCRGPGPESPRPVRP